MKGHEIKRTNGKVKQKKLCIYQNSFSDIFYQVVCRHFNIQILFLHFETKMDSWQAFLWTIQFRFFFSQNILYHLFNFKTLHYMI